MKRYAYRFVSRITLILGLPLYAVISMPSPVYADVNNFIINDFSADYVLSNQDMQGTLDITERITLTFSDNNHGILRAIPQEYNSQDLRLHVSRIRYGDGAEIPYSMYSENGNSVLKIGDPNKAVTGKQTYEIQYSLHNVISFYNDHDELYWDINGDQWQQPFEHVSIRLQLPDTVKLHDTGFTCFTGQFGSSSQSCISEQIGNELHAATTQPLSSGQTLTIVAGFQKGFFAEPTASEKLREILPSVLKFALPIVLFGGYALRQWLKRGRDPKGRGTIVPEYEPPFDMRPAEVGVLADFKVDQKDISATIIDLAVRRYIKIIETKKERKLRKDSLEYSLELTNSDFSKLGAFEQELIRGLFGEDGSASAGSVVALKDLKNKFYKNVSKAQTQIMDQIVEGGYFTASPLKAGGRLWVLVVILFASLFFFGGILGAAGIAGIIVAVAIVIASAVAMPARTLKGVEAKEKALGLKLYLETAEADRIKMLQSPNARYAPAHTAPAKTVELFEKLLPFAVIFGVEKLWALEFKEIYSKPPEWYSGTSPTFNSLYIASALSGSMNNAMTSAFSAPSSSSSSGFGGGGFSGGGGGGGGGGGW
jgi:uncharacterized membrane protein